MFLVLSSSACARYGIKNDESRQHPIAQISLNMNFLEATNVLQDYFKQREWPYTLHNKQLEWNDYEVSWIRDSSLELYYLQADTRIRHLIHWKSIWRLEGQGTQTLLTVHIRELLYMGPQENSGPIPTLDGQWVSAPQSNLRAWLELRRFFTTSFPQTDLPLGMMELRIPRLNFDPISLKFSREQKHYRSSRPSAF